ncbi:hypothetical protein [Herbiconiux sp.]|uniref:hypothetical protein n=1 Tax=Herbiconiux sp. TaxID=1871186 RepID=UPI0025B9D0C2|nr:hypothetical protein [Herbiconiux sp.]
MSAGTVEHDDNPDAEGDGAHNKTFNQRLRDRYFGRTRPGTDAAAEAESESSLPKSNQMGFFGRVQRPGGFDRPPEEPVELDDDDLPWELGGPRRD